MTYADPTTDVYMGPVVSERQWHRGQSLIKKGIGRLPGQGPPLAWGKLRSAANVYGHHADFIAMYALTI